MPPFLMALVPQIASAILDAVAGKIKGNVPKEVANTLDSILTSTEKREEIQKEISQTILQYNEQLIQELNIQEKYKSMGIGSYVRPVLTFFVAGVFNVALLAGLVVSKVSFQDYITTLAPINSMLLGFWFGERSALKDPTKGVID